MARGKSITSIDAKIEKQKQTVNEIKDKYDAALAELDALLKKRRELQSKELLKAFENSSRSLEEVMAFMAGNTSDDSDN